MARFKRKQVTYRLTFEDPDLEGLEVIARGCSMNEMLELTGLGQQVSGFDPETATAQDIARVRAVFSPFAQVLKEWNLDDENDQPVPATVDGLLSQDMDFVIAIITAYVKAMSEAPPPLPGTSSSGPPSPEAPPGMAEASTALPSSPGPT